VSTIICCDNSVARFGFGDSFLFQLILAKKGHKLILASGSTVKKITKIVKPLFVFYGGKNIVAATLTHCNKKDMNRSPLMSGFI
jgi:hypothetical protein